ncbi:MAG: glucose/arabinose dehydrogenase [Sulfitobacter sp.]|jgi:glucose/arabinose dehydrogenase
MMRNLKILFIRWAAVLWLIAALTPAQAQGNLRIEPMITGLDAPWGLAPMPDGGVLVTLRGGKLIHQRGATRIIVRGTPKVATEGQGGLLDITLATDFAQSRMLFLTYAKRQGPRGSGTALARARLSDDGQQLEGLQQLFEMKRGSSGGRHFGSRVVQARDGTVFMSIGDRGEGMAAQDVTRHNGSILRIAPDGAIPPDNPFAQSATALPEIWSYGHRNPQGAALDLQGNLWVAEHGAKGGDEVNRIRRGGNFGWPVISYGRHYSGAKIGEGTAKDGMEQPAFYWDPSIAPSGLLIYSGAMFPEWRGHFLVGSLKFDYIAVLAGNPLREVAQIKSQATQRVRDVVQGPEGAIWFISEGRGSVYRITPAS